MTTENQTRRASIVQKIKALMAKTTENGCTEAEALAAATAVNRLMEDYDLTFSDLETQAEQERYGVRRVKITTSPTSGNYHEIRSVIPSIRKYFNTPGYSDDGHAVLFGTVEDTGLAKEMIQMLMVAMTTEFNNYLKSPGREAVNGRSLRPSFMHGMAGRLNARLNEMREAREAKDIKATGRSLVVVKNAIVDPKFQNWCRENNVKLSSGRGKSYRVYGGAHAAGQAAGGRVDLGGGKVGGGGQTRIGS